MIDWRELLSVDDGYELRSGAAAGEIVALRQNVGDDGTGAPFCVWRDGGGVFARFLGFAGLVALSEEGTLRSPKGGLVPGFALCSPRLQVTRAPRAGCCTTSSRPSRTIPHSPGEPPSLVLAAAEVSPISSNVLR